MALKLRVISDHYQQLGKQSSRLFGVTGGKIGRSADNDWILPDPERYVSSHHAEVRFDAGRWILEDVSTNGIFVNGAEVPLSQQGPRQLHDGDRLRMGDYDILVSIDERNDFPVDAARPAPTPIGKSKSKTRAAQRAELEELNVEIDINELLSSSAPEPEVNASGPYQVSNAYGMSASQSNTARTAATSGNAAEKYEDIPLNLPPNIAMPANVSREAGIDWHLKTRRLQQENKSPERPRADALGDLSAGLEAFCRGLGVDPASIGTDSQISLLTLAGQMTREAVLGMMEALKARGDIKSRTDAGAGQLQATDNNPLKVATSVEDALRKLLDNQSSRYLPPVEALRDGFNELRSHQQAVIAAMHAALNSTMNRVDPGELQERFDRSLNRGTLMGAANKLKYWDMYAEFYQVVNQRNSDGLPISFAEEFAQAYTERLAGFKNARKK